MTWLYPGQEDGGTGRRRQARRAWFLLMIIAFVLVSLVHRPKPYHAATGRPHPSATGATI